MIGGPGRKLWATLMAEWVTIIAVALNQEEEKLGLPFGPAIPNTPVAIPNDAFDVIAARSQRIYETREGMMPVVVKLVGQEMLYNEDEEEVS